MQTYFNLRMAIPRKISLLEEWRKIKYIPQGPPGISGTEVFLNLHGYYKKIKLDKVMNS